MNKKSGDAHLVKKGEPSAHLIFFVSAHSCTTASIHSSIYPCIFFPSLASGRSTYEKPPSCAHSFFHLTFSSSFTCTPLHILLSYMCSRVSLPMTKSAIIVFLSKLVLGLAFPGKKSCHSFPYISLSFSL